MDDKPKRQPDGLAARQGVKVDDNDPAVLAKAIELAFNYRGDVTVRRRDGSTVAGYLFDRAVGSTPAESFIRILPEAGGDRVRIAFDDVAELSFSGRDTAEGKSFETWMKRYVQKKLAGEEASIHAESLE